LHHLEVRNLAAAYGSLSVLRGVSLTLSKGEVVALIGPSGSGKSTILRVLMGLTHPTGGEVLIDGAPIGYGRRAYAPRGTAWPSSSSSTTCSRTWM
jgi:polar amino acid transport system ATP-binding protein